MHKAHTNSLLNSQEQQMISQAYTLMAAAELEDKQLWLPQSVTDDRLNQPSSGSYARVSNLQTGKVIWQSQSYLNPDNQTKITPEIFEHKNIVFNKSTNNQQAIFTLFYKVDWEDANGIATPFVFSIYESTEKVENQIDAFSTTLWTWLTAIALLLICSQSAILFWGLKPIKRVIEDLNKVQEGKSQSLDGNYLNELEGLTNSINQLISHESKQRERHRNKLADLAHSIKNPVAIVLGAIEKLKKDNNYLKNKTLGDIEEQTERINQIINYQLTRSVSHTPAPFQASLPVLPILIKITSALSKVYADRNINFENICDERVSIRADEGDVFELLGNLLDNACKYGNKHVKTSLHNTNNYVTITIEDDGPGIDSQQASHLLKRGARADEMNSGQGIGLAVVEDIVIAYQGHIELGKSDLGGLLVTTKIPVQAH